MLGYDVNKGTLDMTAASTAVVVRDAFERVETIAKWLADHPIVNSVDPLTEDPFGYSADEAYALRLYFETFDAIRTNNQAAFDAGRKMTGLQ